MKELLRGLPAEMVLGGGVLLKGFDPAGAADAAALRSRVEAAVRDGSAVLGLTGSVRFRCVPKRECPEGSGRIPLVREWTDRVWQTELSGTLCDCSAAAVRTVLGGASLTQGASVTELTCLRNAPESISCLCWVGDTPRGLLCVALYRAVSADGVDLKLAEHGAAAMSFRFVACAADEDDDEVPCRIVWTEDEEE